MPSYKLYYFNVRGRGEAIRQLLKIAGQPFEDYRISIEEWPTVKPNMPLGKVPVLEVDGSIMIAQTMTILRYIANRHGLAGKTPEEKAKLDSIGEIVQDLIQSPFVSQWPLMILGRIPSTADELKDFFKNNVMADIEVHAPLIEKLLLANGNNGLFLGDSETWVDLFAAETFSRFIEYGDPLCLDAFPHIKSLIARVHSNSIIRKHIEERGESPF